MSTLAERVKEARGERKKAALARAVGLSRSAITQIEDGTSKSISLETAFKMQDETGYSARYIALGEGTSKAERRPEDAIPTEVIDLAKRILALEPAERNLLMKIFAKAAPDHKLTPNWRNPDSPEPGAEKNKKKPASTKS